MIDMAAGSSSEHHMDDIRRTVPRHYARKHIDVVLVDYAVLGASWRVGCVPLEPPVEDSPPVTGLNIPIT